MSVTISGGLAVALGAILIVALAWIGWLAGRGGRVAEDLLREQGEAFAQQQQVLLGELYRGMQQQADRVAQQAGQQIAQVRSRLEDEFDNVQDAVAALRHQGSAGLEAQRQDLALRLSELSAALEARQEQFRSELTRGTLTTLAEQARADRELLQHGLSAASAQLAASLEGLTRSMTLRLDEIGGQVSQRLDDGLKRTNETFASVMSRLAMIDEAQKKIDGLTTNVVSLQALLGDKRARGAFGEVQLEALVRNMLPPGSFAFQQGLPGGVRADCLLMLPAPTGEIAVDAKFPLENYHRMADGDLAETERRQARAAFRSDVRRHVDDIAGKYIIPGTTADSALMFVPAEAVFAEIHAYHPEVVAYAQQKRVWIVSPTTMMAVLNTARAVLKDVETRRQIHVIRDALGRLAKDFNRFETRIQALARHIEQANRDAQEVHVSSRKIASEFARIESARLDEEEGGHALPGPSA